MTDPPSFPLCSVCSLRECLLPVRPLAYEGRGQSTSGRQDDLPISEINDGRRPEQIGEFLFSNSKNGATETAEVSRSSMKKSSPRSNPMPEHLISPSSLRIRPRSIQFLFPELLKKISSLPVFKSLRESLQEKTWTPCDPVRR